MSKILDKLKCNNGGKVVYESCLNCFKPGLDHLNERYLGMQTSRIYDLSNSFMDHLESIANQTFPVLASSTGDILDLIGKIEQEGFIAPASYTIEQVLLKAVNFTNARLPSSIRIVYQDEIVFISTVVYLEYPVCQS